MTSIYTGMTPTGGNCDTDTSGPQWQRAHNPDGTVDTVTDPDGNVTDYGYDTATGHEGELLTVDHPGNLGTESFTYDSLSRVDTATDGKGQVTTYTYDVLDRVTRITFDGDTSCTSRTTCVDYAYDDAGNLTSRIDASGTTTFTYDTQNRPVSKQLPSSAGACSGSTALEFTYDPAGNLATHCDATGTTTYGHDAVNRLDKLAEPGGSCTGTVSRCTTFEYNERDQRTKTHFPTSPAVTQTVTYDGAGRITGISANASGAPAYTYTYTTVGTSTEDGALRASVTVNGTDLTTYGYDAFGQLTSVDAPGTTADETYTYDDRGNRTTKTTGGATTTYAYGADNRLCWTVSGTSANTCASPPVGATTYTHDANGSQTGNSTGFTATYTALDQAASMSSPTGGTSLTMEYADIDSTERTTDGTNDFINSILGVTRQETGTSWYGFIRDDTGNLIARRSSTGTRYYYLTDALGSIIGLIDTSGTLQQQYVYDAWGNLTATPVNNVTTNKWRYAAGYHDTTTGHTKFGTRYYNPEHGRWTQRDPSGIDQHYVYAGNSPCNYTDPSGYYSWDDFTDDVGGVVDTVNRALNCVIADYSYLAATVAAGAGLATFAFAYVTGNLPLAALAALETTIAFWQMVTSFREAIEEC